MYGCICVHIRRSSMLDKETVTRQAVFESEVDQKMDQFFECVDRAKKYVEDKTVKECFDRVQRLKKDS